MDERTYRVEVTGQFDRPEAATRDELLTEQSQHDYTKSAFVPAGTFTYTPTLTRFTLRYLLEVEAASSIEADADAVLEGEVRAIDYLTGRGIPFRALSTSATCLQDVKAKRER